MTMTRTIEVPVDFQPIGRCGRRGVAPPEDKPSLPPGRKDHVKSKSRNIFLRVQP